MNYKLNIVIDEESLDNIAKAGQKIGLIKHTAGSSDTQVAWVTFRPWMNNTVEWTENFAIYASNTQVQSGATINKLSDKMASNGLVYPFAAGHFGKPVKGENLPSTAYIIKNDDDELKGITVGMAQSVVVNNEAYEANPINAVYLPRGQFATMIPLESVDIFLRNDIKDSTVITHITSEPLNIVYKEGENVKTVKFNLSTGKFYEAK